MTDKPEDAGFGALFKNEKKSKPSDPDLKGDCRIKGRKMWVSAWRKEGQKAGTFFSLAFRFAEDQAEEKPKPKLAHAAKAAVNDPFDF
jgi:hypothetical protein